MARSITLSIPHHLAPAEVQKRIESKITEVQHLYPGQVSNLQQRWTGNHMDFSFSVMGQGVTGEVDVKSDTVELTVDLPWALAMFADRIRPAIENEGQKLLT